MPIISTFETLPDEMILHICQYLRNADIPYSFFNLNIRLNTTIYHFTHYLNLTYVTYKQFDSILTNVSPQIISNVYSFFMNGNWTNFLLNKIHPMKLVLNYRYYFQIYIH